MGSVVSCFIAVLNIDGDSQRTSSSEGYVPRTLLVPGLLPVWPDSAPVACGVVCGVAGVLYVYGLFFFLNLLSGFLFPFLFLFLNLFHLDKRWTLRITNWPPLVGPSRNLETPAAAGHDVTNNGPTQAAFPRAKRKKAIHTRQSTNCPSISPSPHFLLPRSLPLHPH